LAAPFPESLLASSFPPESEEDPDWCDERRSDDIIPDESRPEERRLSPERKGLSPLDCEALVPLLPLPVGALLAPPTKGASSPPALPYDDSPDEDPVCAPLPKYELDRLDERTLSYWNNVRGGGV
jgi:hypothetical protein